jgi:hypothetical protein
MIYYQSIIKMFTFISIWYNYPDELEIKDNRESDIPASYLDILLKIDSK